MPKRMTMKVIRMMIEEYSNQEYGGHLDNVKSMARAEFLQLWYDEACLDQGQLRLPGAHPVALQHVLWHLFWKNKPGSLEIVSHCIRSASSKTDLCKKSSTSKWRNNKPGGQSRLPALSLARSLCVSLQSRWLYIVIYHHWAYVNEKRFSFLNFLSESEHFLGVLGMCTPVCGSDVMFV